VCIPNKPTGSPSTQASNGTTPVAGASSNRFRQRSAEGNGVWSVPQIARGPLKIHDRLGIRRRRMTNGGLNKGCRSTWAH
jgi:hypothetical protein